jgi:lipopolysaccharide biosynthesis regulator YciM
LEERTLVVREQPMSAVADALLGHALYFNDRLAAAAAELRKAAELDSNLVIAHFYLGKVLRDSGDTAGAVEQLRTVVKRAMELPNSSPNWDWPCWMVANGYM